MLQNFFNQDTVMVNKNKDYVKQLYLSTIINMKQSIFNQLHKQ